MPGLLTRENVHRDGFLATLGSRTWRSHAVAAAALAEPELPCAHDDAAAST